MSWASGLEEGRNVPGGARPKVARLNGVKWGYDGVRSISISLNKVIGGLVVK